MHVTASIDLVSQFLEVTLDRSLGKEFRRLKRRFGGRFALRPWRRDGTLPASSALSEAPAMREGVTDARMPGW